MQQKSPGKNSVNHLYEFAEEVGNFGNLTEKKQLAEASTDATAAKNAMSHWREKNAKATNPIDNG